MANQMDDDVVAAEKSAAFLAEIDAELVAGPTPRDSSVGTNDGATNEMEDWRRRMQALADAAGPRDSAAVERFRKIAIGDNVKVSQVLKAVHVLRADVAKGLYQRSSGQLLRAAEADAFRAAFRSTWLRSVTLVALGGSITMLVFAFVGLIQVRGVSLDLRKEMQSTATDFRVTAESSTRNFKTQLGDLESDAKLKNESLTRAVADAERKIGGLKNAVDDWAKENVGPRLERAIAAEEKKIPLEVSDRIARLEPVARAEMSKEVRAAYESIGEIKEKLRQVEAAHAAVKASQVQHETQSRQIGQRVEAASEEVNLLNAALGAKADGASVRRLGDLNMIARYGRPAAVVLALSGLVSIVMMVRFVASGFGRIRRKMRA